MNIMKIIKFKLKIKKYNENHRIPLEKQGNQKYHGIPHDTHENHENQNNFQLKNIKNMKLLKFHVIIIKKMKIIKFKMRII